MFKGIICINFRANKFLFFSSIAFFVFFFILCSRLSFAAGINGIDIIKLKSSELTRQEQQTSFDAIAKDLSAITAFIDPALAESKISLIPYGGIALSYIPFTATDDLEKVGVNKDAVYIPRLYAGINFFSFGAMASYTPLSEGISLLGAQLHYKILSGGIALPTVSLSTNYSTISKITDLENATYEAALGISKGIPLLDFYARLGYAKTTIKDSSELQLDSYKHGGAKLGAGVLLSAVPFVQLGLHLTHYNEHFVVSMSLGI